MQFLQQEDFVLHYQWNDNKKPRTLLFINSLGTDFRIWNGVVELLKNEGNILLFDNRGHGLSGTNDRSKGLEDYLEDTLLLLNHLSIGKCVVIGLSVGGMIAQMLASQYPEMIDKLILCDTRSKIADESFWNNRIHQVELNGLRSVSDSIMQRWFPQSFHRDHPEKVSGYKNMLEQTSPRGYIQTCAAIRDADLTVKSMKIKYPALCIAGSEDLSTTPAEVKELSGLIAGSSFKVIEGSGHLPCIDNPDKLSKLISDFINDNDHGK